MKFTKAFSTLTSIILYTETLNQLIFSSLKMELLRLQTLDSLLSLISPSKISVSVVLFIWVLKDYCYINMDQKLRSGLSESWYTSYCMVKPLCPNVKTRNNSSKKYYYPQFIERGYLPSWKKWSSSVLRSIQNIE